ncbi:MAG: hypothetical protein ABIH92_01805 [Nanoarchaeota archaeon]
MAYDWMRSKEVTMDRLVKQHRRLEMFAPDHELLRLGGVLDNGDFAYWANKFDEAVARFAEDGQRPGDKEAYAYMMAQHFLVAQKAANQADPRTRRTRPEESRADLSHRPILDGPEPGSLIGREFAY